MSEQDLSYEENIAYTQRIRKQIIEQKTAGGIPNDNDAIKILLSALKDHDTTTIADRKNSIDESASQSSHEIAQAVIEMVKLQQNKNPFSRNPDGSAAELPVGVEPRALLPQVDESKLGDHVLVNGEGEIGTVQEDSESFFKRMGVSLNKTND